METSKNSTRQLTLDELISSQEGSLASPTPSQDYKKATKTSATCGRRCCALFENAPRATSWAKTFSALLVGMEEWSSRRCALAWKLKGTRYNRLYFQLQGSEPHTAGLESGLLLTPLAVQVDEPPERYKARHALRTEMGKNNPNDPPGNKYNCLLSQLLYSGICPGLKPGKPSQLSPLFAGEMMGFPNDWTVSPFQSGSAKPSKPTGTQ
jgi:hypothetical protein